MLFQYLCGFNPICLSHILMMSLNLKYYFGYMENYIIIDKSEKYNRETKEYYIDKTKNGKNMIFL